MLKQGSKHQFALKSQWQEGSIWIKEDNSPVFLSFSVTVNLWTIMFGWRSLILYLKDGKKPRNYET